MFRRSIVVWKLSACFITIILLVSIVHGFTHSRLDELTMAEEVRLSIAVFAALLLGSLGTWFTVSRLLERPIRELVAGVERIAGGDLDFRMNVGRTDEFGTVARSLNDMTARLELLVQQHRETRDYLAGIEESSADIIITVNRSGLIQTFNTGAEIVLGYARHEVVGQPVEGLFADPQERDVAVARLRDSDSVANHETKFLTKGGEIREVLFSISRLRGPHGFPIGTFAIGKDVTNEKELQRKLIQSERFAAIGQSFTAIQHAMKNMLNALTGGSYMVKTGIKNSDWGLAGEGWDMVEEGISKIKELSRNLLMYVKDWEPEFDSISVAEIVRKINSVFARTASDRGVTFTTCVPPDLPNARCDANLIHAAIMDIVSNALEACESHEYNDGMTPRVELTVTCAEESGRLAVEIRDNGPGMTEEVKAHVFTPFFSTKKRKGTGLGLALTSRIVSLHGGSIDVVSEPGRGAAFRILLPVAGPDSNKEDHDGEEGSGH